jgi:LmbE family N-acetylglucosaminyl deacetylase
MKTIYLSPHLDDAVFSCGGWIWEQVQRGQEVEIWTIFAGDPPPGDLSDLARSIHQSWNLTENVVETRREEDQEACRILGAGARYFPFPDCIYRFSEDEEPFYQQGEDIFGGLDPREADLIDQVSFALKENLPEEGELIIPLAIGNHVDHEVTRKAATRLGRCLSYYTDYPYARDPEGAQIIQIMENSREWQADQLPISAPGMDLWWRAARAYGSQISTFWEDESDLRKEISEFSRNLGGFRLWKDVEGGP